MPRKKKTEIEAENKEMAKETLSSEAEQNVEATEEIPATEELTMDSEVKDEAKAEELPAKPAAKRRKRKTDVEKEEAEYHLYRRRDAHHAGGR